MLHPENGQRARKACVKRSLASLDSRKSLFALFFSVEPSMRLLMHLGAVGSIPGFTVLFLLFELSIAHCHSLRHQAGAAG